MRLLDDKKNLFSLILIQGANAVFPIFAFPFLYKMLDADNFAKLVLFESLSLYVLAIVLYGFDITGVQKIKSSNDKSVVYCGVLVCRLFILLMILISSILLYLFYNFDIYLWLIWMLFPLGSVLQSNYFFQAIEDNFPLSIIILLFRSTALLAIFLMESNLYLSSFCIAGSYFLSGVASCFFLFFKKKIIFKKIKKDIIKNFFYESSPIAFGNIFVPLYRGTNVILLSMFSDTASVAMYALSEKIIKFIQALSQPIAQLVTPRVVWCIQREPKKAFLFLWQYTRKQLYFIGFVCVVFCVAFQFIENKEYNNNIFIMLPAVFVGTCNYMYGTVGLTTLGRSFSYSRILFFTGMITFLLSVIMASCIGIYGVSVSYVIGELLPFIFIFRKIWEI